MSTYNINLIYIACLYFFLHKRVCEAWRRFFSLRTRVALLVQEAEPHGHIQKQRGGLSQKHGREESMLLAVTLTLQ